MNCRIAHDLLQQSLDGTPIESPEWLAHLQQCAECRALTAAGRRLQDGLRLLTSPLPPSDLAERIVERVRLDRRRARRRWAIGLALAASLLLALLETTRQLTLALRPTATANRQLTLPGSSSAQKEKSAPTLRESAAQLGEAFAELSNETAEETVGQTRRWMANVPRPTLPSVDLTVMGPPPHPLREAGEGLSEGLEPVTTSARRAVDLFLRELPRETKTN